jgi:hypothetical protein
MKRKMLFDPILILSLILASIASLISAPEAQASMAVEFTNCAQTGPFGPSQAQCDTAYVGTPLEGQVTLNNGIQFWTVPTTGVYTIEAFGAKGGFSSGGFGARMRGDFYLVEGTTLRILVGQMGISAPYYYSWGGGGGTFVVRADDTPLVIAGGGGGGAMHYMEYPLDGGPGRIQESGGPDGNGGQNGNGGQAYDYAGGGGGFYTDGDGSGGQAFLNGGVGSTALNSGGFGGGGGTSNNAYNYGGGGGGYSGGNGGGLGDPQSGGGGSYNDGSNQDNTAGANDGHGRVIITINELPVADAGPDQSVNTNELVTLDGTASIDPDGDLPLTYGWVQAGGPAVIFTTHLSVTAFTAPADPAVLTFTLTVTDSLGLADPTPDEVVVTVDNQAPVADAGPDQSVNTNELVALDGTASIDPDGDLPLTYGWVQAGGPAVIFTTHLSVTAFTAPADPAVLTFTLTVSDSLGLPSAPDTVVITVQAHRIFLPLVLRD